MGLRHLSEVRDEAVRLGKSWRLENESGGGLVRVGSLAKEKCQLHSLSRWGPHAVNTYKIQENVYRLSFATNTQSANCKSRLRHSIYSLMINDDAGQRKR